MFTHGCRCLIIAEIHGEVEQLRETIVTRRPARPFRTQRRRELRDQETEPEALLWSVLRAKRLAGLKFRRQHPIGPYFADFACVVRHVVVELDGEYHDYQNGKDRERQTYMESLAWQVIRFDNEEVLTDGDAVAISIARQIGVEPVFKGRRFA